MEKTKVSLIKNVVDSDFVDSREYQELMELYFTTKKIIDETNFYLGFGKNLVSVNSNTINVPINTNLIRSTTNARIC